VSVSRVTSTRKSSPRRFPDLSTLTTAEEDLRLPAASHRLTASKLILKEKKRDKR